MGDAEITEADLAREVRAQARGRGGPRGGRAQRRAALEAQALAQLLEREAIEQEAADRDIRVREAAIRRRWRAVAGKQFATRAQLRRFLGGQTVADVVDQLRLQELLSRVHEQIRDEAGGGRAGERAVREFEREFRDRWAERSACAERYSAAGCDKP